MGLGVGFHGIGVVEFNLSRNLPLRPKPKLRPKLRSIGAASISEADKELGPPELRL